MDFFHQPADDIFGGHSLGLGLEIGADPVPEYRDGDFLDILGGYGEAAIHGGQCLASMDQKLARPGTGAPIDQFANEWGCRIVSRPGCSDQRGDILNDVLTDGDRADQFLQIEDGSGREDFFQFRNFLPRGCGENLLFLGQ